MKAVVIKDFVTSLAEIRVSEVPDATRPHDGFLIRVNAAGVNFVDILYAQGRHQNNRSLVRPPFTLGLEFAGTVVRSPPRSEFTPGDRVFGTHTGSYSEFVSLPPTAVIHRVPPAWTLADAAGVAATLPVAYGALLRAGCGRDDIDNDNNADNISKTVLVHAAAGGLGTMAVQVAAALGHRVIGTAGSAAKCAVATRHGADACVDYSAAAGSTDAGGSGGWWTEVLELTGGRGVDVVFDPVGLVDASLKCVAHFGKVLVVGFAGGAIDKVAVNRVLLKQVSLIGYRYGETLRRSKPLEERMLWEQLRPMIDSAKIVPIVFDERYQGLGSVPRALKDMADRKVWGKAVVTLDERELTAASSTGGTRL